MVPERLPPGAAALVFRGWLCVQALWQGVMRRLTITFTFGINSRNDLS